MEIDSRVLDLWKANATSPDIAKVLGKTVSYVKRHVENARNLGDVRAVPRAVVNNDRLKPLGAVASYSREQLIRMDSKFRKRMLAAIKRKTENPPLGVYKANRNSSQSPGRRFYPEPMMSGCGSPSQMCAEISPELNGRVFC